MRPQGLKTQAERDLHAQREARPLASLPAHRGGLRIAQIAPLWESVPPGRYGGTERVVSWLTEELVARGHAVTLFASGDSKTSARLVAGAPRALRGSRDVDPLAAHLRSLACLQRMAHEFDVIHCHADVLGLVALRHCATPTVTTLHGRLDLAGIPDLLHSLAEMPLVSISDAQRLAAPRAGWIGTVYHGLPLERCPVGAGTGDYAVFLGRISPEKRPDAAIRIARRAGVRLVIAAKVDEVDRRYFEAVVEPLLRGPGVEFLGEIRDEAKVALLGDARALLFPVLWPEPFGLAMIEAMACGTPVLARRCGSTPEVVDDPRVGVVCDDDCGLVEALRESHRFDRAACRAHVERRFSVDVMAERYEGLYRSLVGPERRPERAEPALVLEAS